MSEQINDDERERRIQAMLKDGLSREQAEFALDLPEDGIDEDGALVDP